MAARARPGADDQTEVPEGTPEFYVDSVSISTQLYGSTMLLGTLRPGLPAVVKVVIKMSPPMAKVMSLILSKHVRQYEEGTGPVTLPKELYHKLGLEEYI